MKNRKPTASTSCINIRQKARKISNPSTKHLSATQKDLVSSVDSIKQVLNDDSFWDKGPSVKDYAPKSVLLSYVVMAGMDVPNEVGHVTHIT